MIGYVSIGTSRHAGHSGFQEGREDIVIVGIRRHAIVSLVTGGGGGGENVHVRWSFCPLVALLNMNPACFKALSGIQPSQLNCSMWNVISGLSIILP